VRGAGLTPVVLDVDAFAIENMYGINYDLQPDDVTALVNVGASVMNINIMKGGTSVFTRDISIGGNRYTEAIQRDMGVPYEDAEGAKKGQGDGVDKEMLTTVIDGVSAEVASEIARSVDYFKTTSEGDITKIFLCGGCAKVAGLVTQLNDRMGVEVELANPFRQVDTTASGLDPDSLPDIAPLAAVGVGLALRMRGDR
jgi:type IV pilus assembly protein PilM